MAFLAEYSDLQSLGSQIPDLNCNYCKYSSQGIFVFLVRNAFIDSKLLTDYYCEGASSKKIVKSAGHRGPVL